MSSDLKSNVHQTNLNGTNLPVSNIYDFENFRLDAEHRMLYRDGVELSLTPKQVETLVALVERPGEIISIDALMTRLWGDAAVEEANLIQNIYILRKALGETSNGRPIIETLRRRGYRFNCEVRASGNRQGISNSGVIANTIEMATADHVSTTGISAKKKLLAVAAILLVVISVTGIFIYSYRLVAGKAKRSFAVLPLRPIDPNVRDPHLEVGVADALINRLSSINGFLLRPLSATREYNDISQDPLKAGREQKVDYVLASNYQLADGKIRITSQLINVATGEIEAPYKFENDASNVFAIQDAVATDLAGRLVGRFNAADDAGRRRLRGTTNEDAYKLYLDGMLLYDRRDSSSPEKAVEMFDRAVAIDPGYAAAWAGKALAHAAQGHLENGDSAVINREVKTAIERALAIDPNLSEAHSALCESRLAFEWDFAGAEQECRRAVDLDPYSSVAHNIYARYLVSRGMMDDGLREIRTAVELNPTSYWNQRILGVLLYMTRHYDEAAEQYRRLYAMNEKARPTIQWMIRTLEAKGDYAQAYEWFQKSLALDNADNATVQMYNDTFKHSGWLGVIREREKRESPNNYFRLAGWNARLGNKDKAFELLEKYFQHRGYLLFNIQNEEQFDSLHDDPRFADLLRRIENHKATDTGS